MILILNPSVATGIDCALLPGLMSSTELQLSVESMT